MPISISTFFLHLNPQQRVHQKVIYGRFSLPASPECTGRNSAVCTLLTHEDSTSVFLSPLSLRAHYAANQCNNYFENYFDLLYKITLLVLKTPVS